MASQSPAQNIDNTAYQLSWDAMNRLLRGGWSWSGHEINSAFVNLGNGRFKDVSQISGFEYYDDARGIAALDWDDDGDQDFFLRNRTGPQVRFLSNTTDGRGRFATVRLRGTTSNRDAIGARVEIETPARRFIQTVRAGSSFLAQSSKRVHFGLGEESRISRLTVHWPDGTEQSFRDLPADRHFTIAQGETEVRALPAARPLVLKPSRIEPHHAPAVNEVRLAYRVALPDLGGERFDGERITLSELRGKPVLINFWASWCTNCAAELHEWAEDRAVFEEGGVEVLALSVDEPTERDAAAKMIESTGFPFIAAMADAEWTPLFLALNQNAVDFVDQFNLPTSLLLDAQGRVAKMYVGPVEAEHIVADAGSLASREEEIVMQAAPYPGRLDALHIPHAIAIRYLKLIEAMISEEQHELAVYFVPPLLEQIETYETPVSTYRRVATVARQISAGLESGEKARELAAQADAFYERAANSYVEALARAPLDRDAWTHLRECVNGMSDHTRAEAMVSNLIAALPSPDSGRHTVEIGRALFNSALWSESLPYLEAAVEADPKDANSRHRLGSVQMRLGQVDEGAANIEQALNELPPYAAAEFVFAQDLENAGRIEQALAHYRRALELDPTYDPAREAIERLQR